MRRPDFNPSGRVLCCDAATDLQTFRPAGEHLVGGIVVALAQLDHVAAAQVVVPVQIREPSWRFFGDEVGTKGIRLCIVDGASDDLFHPAFMQVNARPEHAVSVRAFAQVVEFW